MSKKKYILQITAIIIFLLSVFVISFNWGMRKFVDHTNKTKIESDGDKLAVNTSTGDTISSNTKITLQIQYSKSGDLENKEVKVSDFVGKTKGDLESQGYVVEKFSAGEVSLIKKMDSYAPKKYILGVKDDCLAIYKTDENGNMYIEEETEVKVPTENDYNLLVKGSRYFQFDTKEEAEAKLGEYNS